MEPGPSGVATCLASETGLAPGGAPWRRRSIPVLRSRISAKPPIPAPPFDTGAVADDFEWIVPRSSPANQSSLSRRMISTFSCDTAYAVSRGGDGRNELEQARRPPGDAA